VVTLVFLPLRKILKQREYRYLFILLMSTLGAVFVFEPKLGMPRDWDLFSFAGVPLALFGYYFLFNCRSKSISITRIVLLSVMLGCFSLFPRVGNQISEDISVAHFVGLLDLDKIRNRIGRAILIGYYEKLGKDDKVARLHHRWHALIEKETLLTEAVEFIKQNKFEPAVPFLYRFLSLYPQSHEAWQKLGFCYLKLKEYDSSLVCLNISDGINPYNPYTLYYLGLNHYEGKRYREAKVFFLQALGIDSLHVLAWQKLGQCYFAWGKYDSAHMFMAIANGLNPSDVKTLYNIGAAYFEDENYAKAEELFLKVIDIDSLHSDALNGLANVYMQVEDQAKYTAVLLRLATLDDASIKLLQRVAEYYLKLGDYHNATQTYRRALQKGLDSVYIKQLIAKYPELSAQFLLQAPLHDSSESQQ